MHLKGLSNMEVTQDLFKVVWGGSVVWLSQLSMEPTGSWLKSCRPHCCPCVTQWPSCAGCDCIYNLPRFRIMGMLSSAFLICYFDIAFSPLFVSSIKKYCCLFHWLPHGLSLWLYCFLFVKNSYSIMTNALQQSCLQNRDFFIPIILFFISLILFLKQ